MGENSVAKILKMSAVLIGIASLIVSIIASSNQMVRMAGISFSTFVSTFFSGILAALLMLALGEIIELLDMIAYNTRVEK